MTPARVAVTGRTDGPRPTCGVPRTRDALRSLHGPSTGDAAWTQREWESLFQAQPPEPAGRLRPSTSSCGFAQVRRPEPNSRTLETWFDKHRDGPITFRDGPVGVCRVSRAGRDEMSVSDTRFSASRRA